LQVEIQKLYYFFIHFFLKSRADKIKKTAPHNPLVSGVTENSFFDIIFFTSQKNNKNISSIFFFAAEFFLQKKSISKIDY